MESRSHPISVEVGAIAHKSFEDFAASVSSETFDPTKARATLVDRSGILDRDFILHILSGSREFTRSRAVVVPQPGDPAASTIAVTFHPGDLFLQNVDTENFDGEIIFMVDRSGSMGSKMDSLINVLYTFLRSLPQRCEFNIALFGSHVSWMWPVSQPYSQDSLDTATKQVETFQADLGGTEVYSVLKSVQEHHDSTRDILTNVILLTDGEVWDIESVVDLVQSMSSNPDMNIRFFSLGIGDHVSHRLVEGIGEKGGGYAEVVSDSSGGSWQGRVIQMLKAALTPSRFQCEVDLGQQLANRAPYHIPVMSTFSHLSVYYMVDGEMAVTLPASITVSATTDKGKKLTAQLPLQTAKESQAIHHLAAKALMNDYETGQSWLHALNPTLNTNSPAVFQELLKKEAQDLGTKWSIISKWTSYVAIDRTTAKQHEISVRKAAAAEITQLTRARYQVHAQSTQTLERAMDHIIASSTTGYRRRHRGKWLSFFSGESPAIAYTESLFCPKPVSSMPTRKLAMSVFTREDKLAPGLSLDNILYTQTANGEFKLLATGLDKALIEKCQTNVLDQFMDSLRQKATTQVQSTQVHVERQLQEQNTTKLHSLHLNILAVVHITDEHVDSKALWELQDLKARGWIRRTIEALLGHENVSEISLEELERSIIEELHSKEVQIDEGPVTRQ
ncbi:von Willebrand factor type A domain-containing protein [Aspergillus stella-maris]|uniref:von Willebrand factor type A domain-containing protein n=1 Tax=Aspergillus stella-maris TaxID=1810926 RepID=UPI003CCC94FF